MEKLQTLIQKVVLNTPTFKNVTFEPTLINFFYGRNGSGKSTIGREIDQGLALDWQLGVDPSAYQILTYNEEYIENNIQSYGNIPGVFTITKQNASVKKAIDDKRKERDDIDVLIRRVEKEKATAAEKIATAEKKCCNACWKVTEIVRKAFPETQVGFKNDRKKFVSEIERTTPLEYTMTDLQLMYDSAYGKDLKRFTPYKLLGKLTFPTSPLLSESIVNSSSTPFAVFLRELNATDWVVQGHALYHNHANGKCPYCQQDLPDDFEAKLASCFDSAYKNTVAELQAFARQYKDTLNSIYALLKSNVDNPYTSDLTYTYRLKFDLFFEIAKRNADLVTKKANEPAQIIELEDLSDILKELNALAKEINDAINTNNQAIDDNSTARQKCRDAVWGYMATLCASSISVCRYSVSDANGELRKLEKKGKEYIKSSNILEMKISELNTQTVNTDVAMQSINELIRASGFHGFELQKKPRADYVYELVREDASGKKSVVNGKAMSEGERHFIAFLYFYHEVMGSQSDNGIVNNKIIVIDDPVSSMDSSSLFVIASLVRNIIGVCYNNYELSDDTTRDDHVKQFFCLTHNPYFFREITYNYLKEYECATFYEIKKQAGNRSNVVPCLGTSNTTGGGQINISPVKNTYDALWEEYLTSDDSVILMNVIRQILEYYFLQICGFKNGDLRAELLDKNKKAFDDGTKEQFEYSMASAMINLMNTGVAGFSDNLYFDASAIDPNQLRTVFQKIFEVTNQQQHYNMMTRKA